MSSSTAGSLRRIRRGRPGRLRLQVQCARVDAEPLAGGPRAVAEHVAEVRAALPAPDLGPHAQETPVLVQRHGAGHGRLGEAGPAGARVELRVGREQRGRAGRAAVDPVVVAVDVRAGEGTLGAGLAEHPVLLVRQSATPFLIGWPLSFHPGPPDWFVLPASNQPGREIISAACGLVGVRAGGCGAPAPGRRIRSSRYQAATMPSPPAAPATVTDPIWVSEPAGPTRYSSTIPLPPVWTYRKCPPSDAEASTVPASVAVSPSSVRLPLAAAEYRLTSPLPALEAQRKARAGATQQVAVWLLPAESIRVTAPCALRE